MEVKKTSSHASLSSSGRRDIAIVTEFQKFLDVTGILGKKFLIEDY